jgi:general secretion pathway protein I
MTGRGFTLLEVMIAVAILGLSLTAIFSSEVGAANVAARARPAKRRGDSGALQDG